MPGKPPLGLAVEITTASGDHFQWGKGASVPGDVPQGISFRTKRGEGFADASITLSRRIDRDWPDIGLYDGVVLYGEDGATAYEGRVGANPRSIAATHSMSVLCAGWMAHARDRKFQEIYVDRDFSRWQGPGMQRQAAILLANGAPIAPAVATDSATPALTTTATGPWTAAALPHAEAWYDAGAGVTIGSIYYAWTKGSTVNNADANWSWTVFASSDDIATTTDTSGNLRAAGPGTGTLTATARRYGLVQLRYPAANATDGVSYPIFWTCLAVYGSHGLTKQGTADATNAQGFYASDVIANIIQRFCPQLNANGVQATTFVIPQLAFPDRTDPYDAFLEVNKYHRWEFGVWENRTFTYGPSDLSDYDWQIDLYETGVSIQLQGDSVEDGAFNGITVSYTDLQTGKPGVLTPDTNPELAATDPDNPATLHGVDRWHEITLSSPTTAAAASQIAQAALAEKNTPVGAGSITVVGHIKDRAGHWQQGWKVRAGDRIAITSSTALSDRPRLISETSWDQDSHTLTVTVESTPQRVDAVLDRLATALSAANLS